MQTTQYDPVVIQTFADKLYAQGKTVVMIYSFVGVAVGYFGGHYLALADPKFRGRYALASTIVIGILGFLAGKARVSRLKLEAQVALCHKKIEENTRPQKENQIQKPG